VEGILYNGMDVDDMAGIWDNGSAGILGDDAGGISDDDNATIGDVLYESFEMAGIREDDTAAGDDAI
jgi:hypothetical protein